MTIIGIEQALSEIKQACEDSPSEPHKSPFFLITGAGISFPPVPLANEIIRQCKEIATLHKREAAGKTDCVLDEYSTWFSLAYPQPRQRQRYLKKLIENRPISLANLRLAHLLAARVLTNLVVTTNFDDYLTRALLLFGNSPVVCDHPRTVARIDPDGPELQIVHAHGSYLFYDCANLTGEVVGRARFDRDSSLTILGLLDTILWKRSPILVGYSGWEGDVIMSALKRRLGGGNPLGTALYWFCFDRESATKSPEWLRDNPEVRLVAPPERVNTNGDTSSAVGGRSPESGAEGGTKLPAQHVFEEFIKAFNAPEPKLFSDPFDYFASQLETALPTDLDNDPYSFRSLIERIRTAQKRGSTRGSRPVKAARNVLEALRTAIRESHFRRAWQSASELLARPAALTPEEIKEVRSAMWLAGEGIVSRPPVDKKQLPKLARTLAEDLDITAQIGDLPPGMAVAFPCRMRQFAMEFRKGNESYGAFNFHFAEAIANKSADRDGDGLISLWEALVFASESMLRAQQPQTPVLVGDGKKIALFHSKSSFKKAGCLRGLLIGIDLYKEPSMRLSGCKNDVNLLKKALANPSRTFLESQVTTLVDAQAGGAAIRKEVKKLCSAAKRDDILLLSFSGHALRSEGTDANRAYSLVAHDFKSGDAGLIRKDELLAPIKNSKAKWKIIVLDVG
jgi:Caspase domain/SIR2-like domain